MFMLDNYILRNSALHDQFCTTTKILGKLLASDPQPVSIAKLKIHTNRPAVELMKICNDLSRMRLLQAHDDLRDGWTLACAPGAVSLEHVFLCVIASQRNTQPKCGKHPAKPCNPNHIHHDVDLLVMQATMAINQSVLQHLRRFSLDHLKISVTGIFPYMRKPLDIACTDSPPVLAFVLPPPEVSIL